MVPTNVSERTCMKCVLIPIFTWGLFRSNTVAYVRPATLSCPKTRLIGLTPLVEDVAKREVRSRECTERVKAISATWRRERRRKEMSMINRQAMYHDANYEYLEKCQARLASWRDKASRSPVTQPRRAAFTASSPLHHLPLTLYSPGPASQYSRFTPCLYQFPRCGTGPQSTCGACL